MNRSPPPPFGGRGGDRGGGLSGQLVRGEAVAAVFYFKRTILVQRPFRTVSFSRGILATEERSQIARGEPVALAAVQGSRVLKKALMQA